MVCKQEGRIMGNSVRIAYNLVGSLKSKMLNSEWKMTNDSKLTREVLSFDGIDGVQNMFLLEGSSEAVVIVGKYESRYYTDEDEYYTEYEFFIAFGKKINDSYALVPVFDKELWKFARENHMVREHITLIEDLYNEVVLKQTGALDNSFLDLF